MTLAGFSWSVGCHGDWGWGRVPGAPWFDSHWLQPCPTFTIRGTHFEPKCPLSCPHSLSFTLLFSIPFASTAKLAHFFNQLTNNITSLFINQLPLQLQLNHYYSSSENFNLRTSKTFQSLSTQWTRIPISSSLIYCAPRVFQRIL